jgi:hypothetical protein
MGLFRGEDAVRLILEQPSAPKFLARKLVRYFVFDEPAPPDALIEPLAQELRANDFQEAPVVRRILGSQLFFSDFARGRKIRSPVELACGLLRALEATANTFELAEQLDQLGQGLFYPPNVKGWDGGRAWINSSTLLGRANLVHGLLTSEKTRFAGGTLGQLVDRHGVNQPGDLVAWLEQLLLAVPIPLGVRQQLVEVAAGSAGDQSQRAAAVVHAISALPEFQLS